LLWSSIDIERLNQYLFIFLRKSLVKIKPELSPITESIPQYGHNAVSSLSIQISISLGLKIFKQ
jgi:hypothetical protein